MEDVVAECLILREKGSGTREIFERNLNQKNYLLGSVRRLVEISNIAVLKQLVSEDLGISFAYESICDGSKPEVAAFYMKDISIIHEYNCVCCQGALEKERYWSFADISDVR